MRAFVLALALAGAAPAAAQDPFTLQREAELRAEQEFARQRSITQHNELMALEARIRAEQAILDIQAQRLRPILPAPADPQTPSVIDSDDLVSIPSESLAESNRRVREAVDAAR